MAKVETGQTLPEKLECMKRAKRTHMKLLENNYYCYGKILTLRINVTIHHRRRWITIGEICSKCGMVAVYPTFQKGVPNNVKLHELTSAPKN